MAGNSENLLADVMVVQWVLRLVEKRADQSVMMRADLLAERRMTMMD